MLSREKRTQLMLAGVPVSVNQATKHKIYADFQRWQERQSTYDNLQAAYDSFLASLSND